MQSHYQARWISRRRIDELKRARQLSKALYLNVLRGTIVVEPEDSKLGDGPTMSPKEADYELQPVWALEGKSTLRKARQLLGLETGDSATTKK